MSAHVEHMSAKSIRIAARAPHISKYTARAGPNMSAHVQYMSAEAIGMTAGHLIFSKYLAYLDHSCYYLCLYGNNAVTATSTETKARTLDSFL